MSGGGGGSGNGGGDMQVSGAEAAYSQEKGISTHADTRVSQTSFSPGGDGEGQVRDQGGVHDTGRVLGPDTSTVGIAAPEPYSDSEIEKGYTDDGVKLSQVGAGKYMTKEQMYNTGLIEKDSETGEDVQGRYKVNENTGELERTDMSFADHWKNAPEALKYSPTLRLLYASGKNIGEWMGKKGFEGYGEAGKRTNSWNWSGFGNGSDPGSGSGRVGDRLRNREMMNELAPEAPYIVSGTTAPTNSPAANWFQNLGNTSTNPGAFNLATEYAAAKSKVATTLGTSSAVGQLAVNQSPFYNWLKDNSLDKGIL
jgi:hypothetical protein